MTSDTKDTWYAVENALDEQAARRERSRKPRGKRSV
jgi:hypothetical protein